MNPAIASIPDSDTIQAIFDYATRIGGERDFDELMRLNADFARDLAGADRCSLWLIDSKTRELWTKVAHGVDPIRIQYGTGFVGACIVEDQTILVNDAQNEPMRLRRIDSESGYVTRCVLCVPLRTKGKVIGALQLLNKPGGFIEKDASILGLLAHFSASALETERLRLESENARIIRHELTLAKEVQARLLPEHPSGIPGLLCSGLCRPARTIGGDYYDLLQLHDGQFAITVGDVSGKGIPAAVMMASLQMLLRNSLRQAEVPSLSAMVADVNRTLYASSTAERYTTLFCGLISSDRSTLLYVNAGHVAPLLVRHNGSIERLLGSGVPVGLLPEWSSEQFSADLYPGDILIIVSDGVIEACNRDGDFWDEDEIEQILRKHIPLSAAEVPQLLSNAVDLFADGAEPYDDLTVVALEVC
jgi:sigma-B regulation protein RsbU (phosphoserine phosphatase)